MSAGTFEPTERTRAGRKPQRAHYDRETVESILDEALFCHVASVDDAGGPRAIPTIHVRVGDAVYIHGSTGSRTLRSVKDGQEVCLVVTILDGLVFARSAFNHSMNYRSVVVFGTAREVTDPDEKWRAQAALVEHVCAGRSEQARMPTKKELVETMILAIPLAEASAKIRTGPPIDDEDDVVLPIWAGVLPVSIGAGRPEDAPDLPPGVGVPENVRRYRRTTVRERRGGDGSADDVVPEP
jgi:nitroimidazol reductase NimA-like FMN-containing flavoprotein (pyridoxamine 5'-phosphate oxidase superfamily)